MAAGKTQELERRAKEARQKKMLLVLAPILIGLLAWQGPKTFAALTGGESAAASPPPAATEPAAAPSTEAPAGAPAAAPDVLPDSDVPPAAGQDQLISFSRFVGRDPFWRGAPAPTTTTPTTTQPAGSASIEVNGSGETVQVNGEFPAADPVFRLLAISGQAVKVGLVSGSFEGGTESVDVSVGETVVLVAEPDGTRYTVKVVSVS